ncbi:MAG: hypothetical protein ACI841_000418 [Planctomycetota bacterium]|jgi:hypothetical protein
MVVVSTLIARTQTAVAARFERHSSSLVWKLLQETGTYFESKEWKGCDEQ